VILGTVQSSNLSSRHLSFCENGRQSAHATGSFAVALVSYSLHKVKPNVEAVKGAKLF
jgi:hypothetical protein